MTTSKGPDWKAIDRLADELDEENMATAARNMRALADIAEVAYEMQDARPKGCIVCGGRLDRPPGHIQTPCAQKCPGRLMRIAFAQLGDDRERR